MITDKMVQAARSAYLQHIGEGGYPASDEAMRLALEAADLIREEGRVAMSSMIQEANDFARAQWPFPPEETK